MKWTLWLRILGYVALITLIVYVVWTGKKVFS